MPSLKYGVRFATPHSRWLLLSFSVKSNSGSPAQAHQYSPSRSWVACTRRESLTFSATTRVVDALSVESEEGLTARSVGGGRSPKESQAHSLRNQRVGSRWRTA